VGERLRGAMLSAYLPAMLCIAMQAGLMQAGGGDNFP